ncbi:TPA: UDP-N-acetylmuramate--L-alanine ligase [Candidatus Nomurabacteria bacterium]|uniref:UDP-N-acetylmuramate--L-alanine ligase n=2 Tax=Candidatus Nomuraibacteriota TaxID=1752729 RepID=A0A1F6YQB9_9BACT|nr:MAG: UDP-N-acetylmuramate-L-alanine ligase [Parcubacteria group bacterium GW2011_GWC1_42_21]KKS99978.1 MAG: UDP-N-acetylmuramate-L-alanine ligase [Candidatus Nomurabacteria bacterium GW2011_GWA1_43_17]KKT06820.1 MAG: UDP-N-acetylmuramate-L-alanine ligase [Candidatus Nomurabacteria bacterium GW2011_GWB1_43_19]KKT10831.1 MAG: UDP-N-acetylmuramate-L-alanine ligase [Candidatus Nomurabacteria bacterium GW2011_GWF2_43_24]KKT17790.1 MAG: UDP-N-acetylmuramate-L-alanine ligase [Candidatus Nomurabacte
MNPDLSKIKKVFFIGIGGIGTSAIARMMHLAGKDVSGSDMSENELTNELKQLGINITIGQGFKLILPDTDLIVYTIAIPRYDPVLFQQVKNSNILYKSYPEMLGLITANKYTIAVAGTHGKTTTTAMIAKILIDAKLDPSVIVGSLLNPLNFPGQKKSNLIVGQSEYFIVEACEYERSFLNIKPKLSVITNIEADHLDYYKDLEDIKSAFQQFTSQSEKVIRDYTGYLNKVPKLKVPGEHNRLDAAAAYAVAKVLNIKDDIIQKSLAEFSGTWRRLEKKAETEAGTIIYDDYAHHPTEIRASIEALRELYPISKKKITIVFQPHLYSRTKALFEDFAKCFKGADRIILLPIYFAREDKDESISSGKLAEAICKNGEKAIAFTDFELAENYLKGEIFDKNEVFVTMGAGEAYKVADKVFNLT